MKRLFLLFIILIYVSTALHTVPVSDARFLDIEVSYRLQNDGSWDMECRQLVRLDTYYAVNRALGETFIVYNPDFQKLEVLKSETTMADGRKVASPANAFNEVLPRAAHGFADFSHLREMVVTHTGLERGAIVELKYRIHTKPGFLPVFSGREPLIRDFPVDRYRLTITVPVGGSLRYRVFGSPAQAKVSDAGAEKIYTFELASLPPAAHEALAPAWSEPAVVFSMAADWPQALALADDAAPLPAALTERIGKIKAQYPARPDLLAALQNLVAVEIQNCGLGNDATGWQPRSLDRVFASNYATRLEKALLLRALLKETGFATELLGVAAGASFAADVATPLQLNEFWLKVSDGPHELHLDPGHEQHEFFPYGCQGLDGWNFERQAPEKLPVSAWEANGIDISGAVQLGPEGASGTLVVAARGIFNRYEEAAADSSKFVSGLLKKFFPVEKAEVKKILQLTRHEIRVEAAFSGPWLKESGAGLFSVDACRLPGLSENMVQQVKRELPLALEAPFKISLELDLQPAAGLTLDYSAPEIDLTNETGYFSRKHSVQKNGHILFSESCGILNSPVTPELYPRLRALLLPYFTPDFWLVFKKDK